MPTLYCWHPLFCSTSGITVVVLVTELVGLSDINNHPFIVPPSDAVFSFRSFSREHDLATVKVGGKEAGLASCWLAICPRRGWISFFVIAESSELILCSVLCRSKDDGKYDNRVGASSNRGDHMMKQIFLLYLSDSGVLGNLFPAGSSGSANYVCYNVNWTVHRTI